MKKWMKCFILAASVMELCIPTTAMAAQRYETSVINGISIGEINIALENIIENTDNVVIPGQTVTRTVRVLNMANPAWLRIRCDVVSDEIDNLDGVVPTLRNDAGWIYKDGYYYCKNPIPNNESVEFTSAITIPVTWTEDTAGKQFAVNITAQAVQEANFVPDFNSEQPWYGTVIETSTSTEPFHATLSSDKAFVVEFRNGSEGLIHTGDDFFSGLGTLMPGDILSDTVELYNAYNRTIDLYFTAEPMESTLAKEVQLEIKDDASNLIFSGSLSDSIKDKLIATLKSGERKTLIYTVSVPADLKNADALSSAQTKWIFMAEIRQKSNGSSGGGSSHSSVNTIITNNNNPEYPNVPEKPTEEPKKDKPFIPDTGDRAKTGFYLAGMLISLAGFIIISKRKGKKEDEEEKKDKN